MMASDLSSGCTETIDILDDEKEEGEISLEDVSSSEEGGMGHLTSSYVIGRTRACPDCKSWGECATWCNATYHSKSQGRRDPVKGKENRHHVKETGCATVKHMASKLQEKNDDLVPISSDTDMEIVGLTDTSNRSKAKVKKKKRKKKNYEPLTIDDLISPSTIDLGIADVSTLKIYKEASPGHRPSARSKMISRSPIRRYKSPVVARSSFRSRSPPNHSRSPIQKRSLRKIRSPKRSPRRHSPVRTAKRSPSKLSSLPSTRQGRRRDTVVEKGETSHIDRNDDVTRLLKKVKRHSMSTHVSEPSVNRSKESSLKEKLSNMLKRVGSDDHAMYLKTMKVQSEINDADDEEDLALLRQKALETKQKKSNRSSDHPVDVESEKRSAVNNDDQDEEALQLRMIALRSAVMKKHQNRVQRGIKAKRSTRSESPFSSNFLDDIPIPDDELLKYTSPPCTPLCDSNHIEDMDLDTDVEREKEKLPYSPTDKITENIPIDTALLGIEPSDVSFINVNEAIGSPPFDDAQDELTTQSITPYYEETYSSYQMLPATQYYPSPQYSSETYHSGFNNGKGAENLNGDGVVCDPIDGICQKGTYSSIPDTTHILPVSKNLLTPSGSFLASSSPMQIAEQSTNDDIVNADTFRNDKSPYEAQTVPEYSIDAPETMTYATTKSVSPNESLITLDDLPENDADSLNSPNVALGDDRNDVSATEYIPKEAAPCQDAVNEPLYMQGVPDITKDINKIPTLINRKLVPAPILKSNKRLRQDLIKRELPHPEPTFKSAEMQPVDVTATDASSSVFKIKLQVMKKSTPVLSVPATFDNSMNESLDMSEDQGGSLEKDQAAESGQDAAATPSTNNEAAPMRGKKRKRTRRTRRKNLDSAPLSENEKSPCSDANKDTNIVDASVLNQQTSESNQNKSNDNADAQETGNGEPLKLQSTIDTQESINSEDIKKKDVKKNNHIALSMSIENSQEEHTEARCLLTDPTPDNCESSISDKAVDMTKSDSNRRQSVDEDENELRAILLASLKRTKSIDTSPSVAPIASVTPIAPVTPVVAPVISVANSVATNVQTPALKPALAGIMPSMTTCTSNDVPSLPSKPTSSELRPGLRTETVKRKINDVSVAVQSKKKSGNVDTAKSPKKMTRKALTSTKMVNNAKKFQNMIVQRRLNLRKFDGSAPITKPNENVWSNVGASKSSLHSSDTQRFVISLASDTDSESEGEKNESIPISNVEKHQVYQEIPTDFEKNLNKFLRDMRTEQEQSAAAAKSFSPSTQATKQDVPQMTKGSSNLHTPLAVRHLPASQQEEYRRLKQEILQREKLKLQRKVASNNSNNNNSSNKLSNANITSSPVKSLSGCEKKAHIKQSQDKLKAPEKNSQELSMEVGRKSEDLAKSTSESNVSRISADKRLSANITKHTVTHLQVKNSKKVIPNNLSIRISNISTPNITGDVRTIENSREKQSTKDKQQHRSVLKMLSTEEINRKHVQVLLKPDTTKRVVTISDKSVLQHDTIGLNENSVKSDINTEIITEKNLNTVDDKNISILSNASTVKLLNLSESSDVSQPEDTMETTMLLSQYEVERQREINRDASTSVLIENNNSSNASHKSDVIAGSNVTDVWDKLKKDVKRELDSLMSLSKVEQERYLRETEHKLVAKRYMVLDHLAEMSGNLRQWDMEKDVQLTLASEVKKLKEQLKIAEEKLQQQRDRVSSMGPKVSLARQKINTRRRECFKLSRICSTLGNRIMGKNYKLPEAVAQLLSDKLKEVANHTRQFSKKKRLQSNDISENSYSSLLQETSGLSKDTCTEENLREQLMNNATVIDEMGSKSDTSRLIQFNLLEEESLLTISKTSLEFSQTVPCQSTPEKKKEISANESEHRNEEQITSLNQDCALSSKPKLYQSPTEQNNEHTEGSKTDEFDPAASSELKSSAMDSSNQEYEQNDKRVSPQLLSPSPTTTMTDTTVTTTDTTVTTTDTTVTTTDTTMTTTTTTTDTTTVITAKTTAPYISVLKHLNKSRNVNPHGILCPYEMMGICRDEDCQYIHLSRNQT